MKHSERLGTERIPVLLVQFSLPAIVSMLAQALYNIVDRVFIGRAVGAIGIGGITVAFPFVLVLTALATLIGVGGNSLVSIQLGAGKKYEADRTFGNAISLLIGMFLIATVIGLVFLESFLRLFGASGAILPYASMYMQIMLLGAIFQGVGMGMNTFMRGEGNPKMAMLTMLLGVLLNIVLDPICIFGLNLGIRGAAIATIVSQIVSTIWVLAYFLGDKSVLRIHPSYLLLQWRIVRKILAIGAAPCAMLLTSSLLNLTFNHQLGTYGGDLAISAMGIINSVFMMVLLPIFGISQGVQPIIGYNYGAMNHARVKHAMYYAMLAATGIAGAGFVVTHYFPGQIIGLFTQNEVVRELGGSGMRWVFLAMPLLGVQTIGADYFYAVGKPQDAIPLVLSRQVLFLIPFLLVFPYFWGIHGIWMACPSADVLAAIVTGWCVYMELRQLTGSYMTMKEVQISQ